MLKQKVTLVLGAGASKPYGFPLGRDLKNDIVHELTNWSDNTLKDVHLVSRINKLTGYSFEDIRKFGVELRGSDQSSVDAFLFGRPNPVFIEIGKLAIAKYIIQSEHKDRLPTDPPQTELDKQKWYGYLLNNFIPTLDDIKLSKLSIITFNYDRSLEYYLYYTLQSRYDLSEKEVVEWVKALPIIHVYGQVGKPLFYDPAGRDYRDEVDDENLQKGADGIRLIYDERNNEMNIENLHKIYDKIAETNFLIFIGFSFDEENLKRLQINTYYKEYKQVGDHILAGTFYGMKDGEVERAKSRISQYSGILPINIGSLDMDALDFLRKTNYLK